MSGTKDQMSETCQCRCDQCFDADCDGSVCRPHPKGRWVIVSPYLTHPLPSDFATKEFAGAFLDVLGFDHLSAEVQR